MSGALAARPRARKPPPQPVVLPDAGAILSALPVPAVVLDAENRFRYANSAAELFFHLSTASLAGLCLAELLPEDNRIFALLAQVRAHESPVADHDLTLESPRLNRRGVAAHGAPLPELPGGVVLTLQDGSTAQMLDRQLSFLGAARGTTAMAAMLAHEVKNPLSGIRGAAQLLEPAIGDEDRPLVQLICDETDRICALVERMEQFGDTGPIERKPVNIYQVLEHVRRIAEAGFARHHRIVELYDPSLPEVEGDRDGLIQVFLNLVKNAAEAAPADGGQITLVTQYQHGLRVAVGNSRERLELPITVEVRDNGPGVAQDVADHLFEPFVSTKRRGSGLGLSLVAKVIADHQGVVSYLPGEPGAVFRVRLPAARRQHAAPAQQREVA